MVVPRHDPEALADAIRKVLTTPGLVGADGEVKPDGFAPELAWPYIALSLRPPSAKSYSTVELH